MYANVIVDISHEKLDRTFVYRVPSALHADIAVGMVVKAPFGNANRSITGYVISLTDKSEYDLDKLKEITEVVTETSPVESRLIVLAAWLREYYGATMIQALKTVIPVKKKMKPQEKKSVYLVLGEAEARERLAFYQQKNQKARARLLEALLLEPLMSREAVRGKLNISETVIKALVEQGVIEVRSQTIYRNPLKELEQIARNIALNIEQQQIVNKVIAEWELERNPVYLLHGITGSGKTEVYIEIIAEAMKRGEQAIVLIPEIALTYQTVMRFYHRFGKRISIINSRLSPSERYDQFKRARAGEIDVMIGPRSALFTPFQNLGVIIIDEEHEESYKSESTPRYHARETAVKRGQIEGARVVLGSATPSMEAYYKAQAGEYKLFQLMKRVNDNALAKVEIVDMRAELVAGNRSILSDTLKAKMQERLQRKEQMMLFLNRRGYTGFLSCRSCGKVIKCPHCDVSLTLHNNGQIVCHYCGYQEMKPKACPACESTFLRGFRVGTQQVEEVVKMEFKEAKVLRMDMDTTKEKDGHEKILAAFTKGEADILVGTQMIVKGHDFPNVTLVAALAADMSLYVSDYRAGERTFQLLTQAAGRAGRGAKAGEMVIQTYDPENYSIVAASIQDYQSFYQQELVFRSLGGYPPAAGMLVIHGAGAEEAYLQKAMEYLQGFINKLIKNSKVQMIGPADGALSKVNDIYRKVIYLKHKDCEILVKIKDKVEQYIEVNKGYESIYIQFDMN